jgi:lipopolysaccharide export system permease protein
LTVVNREVWIPQVKDRLVREPQTWHDDGQVGMMVQEDLGSGVVLRGDQLFLGERRVSEADAQLPNEFSSSVPRVTSNWAIVEPATDQHPAGLWFHQVGKPAKLTLIPSLVSDDGQTVLYTPRDHAWLKHDQCFIACDFDVETMAYGNKLASFRSTPQLIAELRKPRKWFGNRLQVGLHSRLLMPVLDLTLLMLGLPLVIGGIQRNVFVSAVTCFLIVGTIQLTTIACHSLGATNLIRPAAMAAWLPVAIFFPFAIVAMRKLKN